ncbi:MAG: PilZ domain-containing protein [Propionibacteriales bacterium]|nr:PilZ domain-containing protein [Propionibacteriales bacterium]
MSVHADPAGPEVHPAILQAVALRLRPTAGEPVDLATRVLDVEPQPDGRTTLVVACPEGHDPLEHHFDATVSWTYPLGRMECPVSTRPGRRAYGRVWLLRPTAPATRIQERAFFRARVSVPVVLAWQVESDEDVEPDHDREPERHDLTAVAVDLGEGGLLAVVRTEPPAPGTLVEATVRVDGVNYAQAARVVRHVSFASGGTGVAIAFLDPTVHGDRFRRLVFESERRRRRIR